MSRPDDDAFEDLVRPLADRLFRTALLLCGSHHQAEDLVQTTLAKFYASLLKSEARHFQDYLKLARTYGDKADVDAKLEEILLAERDLIESPDPEFRFHSGTPVFV